MSFPAVMTRYMIKTYAANIVLLLLVFLSIIYLFDTIELIRRASKHPDIPLVLVFQMAFLKLPEAAHVLFPFAIMFSAMFTLWQLTKRYELVILRASGYSVWQFLMPMLLLAAAVGVFHTGVLNPVGAVLLSRFDHLERIHLTREKSQIALFKDGLWLRQSAGENDGYAILHAPKITQPGWKLHDVHVLYFDGDDRFYQRIDAQQAQLDKHHWRFNDVSIHRDDAVPERRDNYTLSTNLTVQDVEDSFASPDIMSFWRLPGHIKTLEETGFDASRLKVHHYTLLAQPLMFAAMVLLAATVSMRPPRLGGSVALIGLGIFLGFVVFFVSSYLQALGASRQLPAILAAWTPALVCTLLGTTTMMTLEDG